MKKWTCWKYIGFSLIFEAPLDSNPTLESTLSLLYLGVVATGFAWLIRFRILTVNGLVFQTQVAYLIPIFGVFAGYFFLDEVLKGTTFLSILFIAGGIYISQIKTSKLIK